MTAGGWASRTTNSCESQNHTLQHRDWMGILLTIAVVLVTAAQVINGWIQQLNPQAAKLPSVFLVGLWMLDLRRSRRRPYFGDVSIMLTCLLIVVLISGAGNTGESGLVLSLSRWVPFLVTAIILTDVMATRISPFAGLVGMALGATSAGFGAIVSFAVLGDSRATGPMEDPNDLAYVLTAALPILLVGIRGATVKYRRTLSSACVVASVICVVGAAATLSRGGAMAIGVLLIWAVVRRLLPWRAIVYGIISIVIVSMLAMHLLSNKIETALAEKTFIAQYNVETRSLRWEGALRGFAHHPLLGMGPGGAAVHYGANSSFAEMDTPMAATHNMYIEVAADLGVLGSILFMMILFATFRHTIRSHRIDARLALAVEGSLLAICTSSAFLSEEYYMPLWATIAVGAAVAARRGFQGEIVL